MNDKEIIQGLRKSQLAAYEALIDTYTRYVTCVIRKVAANQLQREDIEELCADIFIKLWERREQLEVQEDKLRGYLGAMARNHTFNKLRGNVQYQPLPLEEDVLCDIPYDTLVSKEDDTVIQQVIQILPEPDREIFIRRYFYFEKLSSIAEKIGLPLGTVGTKLARGKKKLEVLLKERGIAYE